MAQRFGSFVPLKPEMAGRYRQLHQSVWPDVAAMIRGCHIENYSIYIHQTPDGRPVRLAIVTHESRLLLPERPPREADADILFAAPEAARPTPVEQRTTPHHNWRVIRDLAADESTLEVINDNGTVYFPALDLEFSRKALEWYRYRGSDFNSVRGETQWERGMRRGDWSIRTLTRTVLTSTPEAFLVHAQLDAYEGERRVFAATWNETIARDLV